MSTGLMERVASDGGELVAPNQALAVSESSRAMAEIQAQLTVAQARPRDQLRARDRIMVACQRPRLAEMACYQYRKGTAEIRGPSVRLLECIAQNWGNIQFGFRELAQGAGESTVEAYAWDCETNAKRSLVFVVPHRMKSGKGFKQLTDPRDIYEFIANQAQRRVRACLEAVIPRDVIEEAVEECDKTLHQKVELTKEKIQSMVTAFGEYGIKRQQIEARYQRPVEQITPAQFVGLRRIYNSIKDGMSEAMDHFKPLEDDAADTKKSTAKSTTEKLKAGSNGKKPASKKGDGDAKGKANPELKDDGVSEIEAKLQNYGQLVESATTEIELSNLMAHIDGDDDVPADAKTQFAEEITEKMNLSAKVEK